jgi:hypothetical protein
LTAVESNFVLTIHFNRSDIDGTGAFRFMIYVSGDSGATTGEKAPDTGAYTFNVAAAQSTPTASTTTPTIKPPPGKKLGLAVSKLTVPVARAGHPFRALLSVRRTDTGKPLTGGTLTCSANAGGKALQSTSKAPATSGVASCTWAVPKSAKGKTLAGQIAVAFKTAKVARTFSTKIR